MYKETYEKELRKRLIDLKKKNKKLAIATYNSDPEQVLIKLRILHLFDYIYQPTELTYNQYISNVRYLKNATVWTIGNNVKICWNKNIMVEKIMKNLKCSNDETIFFDDYINNVYDVEKLGVKTIHVNKNVGIPLRLLNSS
jgi:FMN phosphatase YigB (HAD superfamily)